MRRYDDEGAPVRRVPVSDPPLAGERPDYADAFEVRTAHADPRSAEQFARAALEDAPLPVRVVVHLAHRHVLGMEPGPRSSPEHVFGWRIVSSQPEAVTLEAASRRVRGVIVVRVDPNRARVTTSVFLRRPVAHLLWAVLAPVHRAVARYLLRRAVAGAGVPAAPRLSPR